MAPNRINPWFGAILLAVSLALPARALTIAPAESRVCPVCRHNFEPILAGSGTQTGMRLDFRPLGPIASPWPIPDCPNCHNVWFPSNSPAPSVRDTQSVAKLVRSPVFGRVASAPTYHRLALTSETLKKPARNLAMLWLAAAWQWEGTTNRVQERLCLDHCAAWLDRHLESKAGRTGAPDFEAVLVRADLYRRSGEFEKATALLKRFGSQPLFRTGLAPRIIARQRLLIAAWIMTPEPLEAPSARRPGSQPNSRPLKLAPPSGN